MLLILCSLSATIYIDSPTYDVYTVMVPTARYTHIPNQWQILRGHLLLSQDPIRLVWMLELETGFITVLSFQPLDNSQF